MAEKTRQDLKARAFDFGAAILKLHNRLAQGGSAQGKELFASAGCSSCHTLADAGASGQVGPNLDETLAGKDAAYVEQAIVDPNAVIAQGYQPNVMPQDFGSTLSKAQIDGLVQYLLKATGGGG